MSSTRTVNKALRLDSLRGEAIDFGLPADLRFDAANAWRELSRDRSRDEFDALVAMIMAAHYEVNELHRKLNPIIEGDLVRIKQQLPELAARLDGLDHAAYEAGAGENTVDYAAIEEADRNDPAKQWTAEDEAADEAELPRTLPHQP